MFTSSVQQIDSMTHTYLRGLSSPRLQWSFTWTICVHNNLSHLWTIQSAYCLGHLEHKLYLYFLFDGLLFVFLDEATVSHLKLHSVPPSWDPKATWDSLPRAAGSALNAQTDQIPRSWRLLRKSQEPSSDSQLERYMISHKRNTPHWSDHRSRGSVS